jgi:hypothetical protein
LSTNAFRTYCATSFSVLNRSSPSYANAITSVAERASSASRHGALVDRAAGRSVRANATGR